MIKVIYFMYRKPGWAVEKFQDYWCSTHADIVRKMPGIRGYTQCHTLLSGYKRKTPAFTSPQHIDFPKSSAKPTRKGYFHFFPLAFHPDW
jgi:uncharacterized protein (TIGR02118 family)